MEAIFGLGGASVQIVQKRRRFLSRSALGIRCGAALSEVAQPATPPANPGFSNQLPMWSQLHVIFVSLWDGFLLAMRLDGAGNRRLEYEVLDIAFCKCSISYCAFLAADMMEAMASRVSHWIVHPVGAVCSRGSSSPIHRPSHFGSPSVPHRTR